MQVTPQQKAEELMDTFSEYTGHDHYGLIYARDCSIACVNEILNSNRNKMYPSLQHPMAGYWEVVKERLTTLFELTDEK